MIASPAANLRGTGPSQRLQIEFIEATPLEYLERCLLANDVFEDDIRLASVIEWADHRLSIGTTQPHYAGRPATHDQIEDYFIQNQWVRRRDAAGHLIFFNYAYQVLAIDAVPRNCYLQDTSLQPFDVILCRPSDELEAFLDLYPR